MAVIVSLILLGLLLLLAELLLVPGVGVAGFAGLLSLGGACWYAWVRVDPFTGMFVTVISIVLVLGFGFYALRAKTWKKLSLDTQIDAVVEDPSKKIKVGDKGKTVSRLSPIGSANFNGYTCEVKAEDGEMIESGNRIEVVAVKENVITVTQTSE